MWSRPQPWTWINPTCGAGLCLAAMVNLPQTYWVRCRPAPYCSQTSQLWARRRHRRTGLRGIPPALPGHAAAHRTRPRLSRTDRRQVRRETGPDGALYVGSPDTVARKIATNFRTLDATRFNLKFNMGMSQREVLATIELYGSKVIPQVRDLLAEWSVGIKRSRNRRWCVACTISCQCAGVPRRPAQAVPGCGDALWWFPGSFEHPDWVAHRTAAGTPG